MVEKDSLLFTDDSIKSLNEAIHARDFFQQIKIFRALSDFHKKKANYLYSVGIENYIINIYRHLLKSKKIEKAMADSEINEANSRIFSLYMFLTQSHMGKVNVNPELFAKRNSEYHQKLTAMRADSDKKLGELTEKYPDQISLKLERAAEIRQISIFVRDSLVRLLNSIFDDVIDELGEPPCEYTIIGFGSFARCEATPYSDFEYGILVENEDKKTLAYFRIFSKLLHFKIINLGETILPALAIPELNDFYGETDDTNPNSTVHFYDDLTPRGLSLDGAMPHACKTPLGRLNRGKYKAFELIHTAEEMVKLAFDSKMKPLQVPDFLVGSGASFWTAPKYEKELHLLSTLSVVYPIREKSNLLERYRRILVQELYSNESNQERLEKIERKGRVENNTEWTREYILNDLVESLQNFAPQVYDQNDHGKFHEVKKEIYRILDRSFAALALYCKIYSTNTFDIIEQMFQHGYISENNKFFLFIACSIAHELRLRTTLASAAQQEKLGISFSGSSAQSTPQIIKSLSSVNMPSIIQKPIPIGNNWEVDVPGDSSCLFWSAGLAYLYPVVRNIIIFNNRFINMFGDLTDADYVRKKC